MAEKSLLFWKPTFGCQKKKQTVRYFRKNKPKNQTELNAIETIFIVVDVVFYTFFFNHSLFSNFISFYCFYPRLFQVRTCVPCVQVLNSCGKFCPANNVFLSSQPFTIQNETNRKSVLLPEVKVTRKHPEQYFAKVKMQPKLWVISMTLKFFGRKIFHKFAY